MFVNVHPLYHALGRIHSRLHPRNVQIISQIGPETYIACCVCKDDGPNRCGIPDIPIRFVFSDNEDWDTFVVQFWRVLEDQKRRLGFYN